MSKLSFKLILIILSITFISSQDFLEPVALDFEEEANRIDAQMYLESIDKSLEMFIGISSECKNALINLKSVIEIIKNNQGTDEKVFYSVKEIVNNFPSLKSNCKIPLPEINTSNWDILKFKKMKCSISAVTFAVNASVCLNGGFMSCAKALAGIKGLGDCIKLIIS